MTAKSSICSVPSARDFLRRALAPALEPVSERPERQDTSGQEGATPQAPADNPA
jgi:hypothetical protein